MRNLTCTDWLWGGLFSAVLGAVDDLGDKPVERSDNCTSLLILSLGLASSGHFHVMHQLHTLDPVPYLKISKV